MSLCVIDSGPLSSGLIGRVFQSDRHGIAPHWLALDLYLTLCLPPLFAVGSGHRSMGE